MIAPAETTIETIGKAADRARAARDGGLAWLLAHISDKGEPVGAGSRNGWARVPWALAVCGESAAAARVIAWAEQGQLGKDGIFLPGPALGTGRFPAYPLAHLAIGAWLSERFDTALLILDALRRMQDPATGGLPIAMPRDRDSDLHDLLSTAQVGLAAVIAGQDDIADGVYRWIMDLVRAQPADHDGRLHTFRQGSQLLIQPDAGVTWLAITDFGKPRQTYYTPGMAAVFLAAYAQRRKIQEPLAMASSLLEFNIRGCAEQYDDLQSVQLCKLGWGVAAMYTATRDQSWVPHLLRMTDWFIARQADNGSWAPSGFLQPNPDDVDRLIKTAEHVMEMNAVVAALGAVQARLFHRCNGDHA